MKKRILSTEFMGLPIGTPITFFEDTIPDWLMLIKLPSGQQVVVRSNLFYIKTAPL